MARITTDRAGSRRRPRELEDYVGYGVRDPEGRKIGTAREIFANGRGEPEYVRVRMGLFGLRSALLPVGFVRVDEQQRFFTLQ